MFSSLNFIFTNIFIEQCHPKGSAVAESDLKETVAFHLRQIASPMYVEV